MSFPKRSLHTKLRFWHWSSFVGSIGYFDRWLTLHYIKMNQHFHRCWLNWGHCTLKHFSVKLRLMLYENWLGCFCFFLRAKQLFKNTELWRTIKASIWRLIKVRFFLFHALSTRAMLILSTVKNNYFRRAHSALRVAFHKKVTAFLKKLRICTRKMCFQLCANIYKIKLHFFYGLNLSRYYHTLKRMLRLKGFCHYCGNSFLCWGVVRLCFRRH